MPDEPSPGPVTLDALFERWGAEAPRIPELVRRAEAHLRRETAAGPTTPERSARHAWIRALYDDHGGAVYSYARSATGSLADADEVVQQTFIDADRKLGAYARATGRPKAWLFCFAVGHALNLNRARRRRLRHEEPAGDALPERGGPSFDARRLDLAAALRTLDPMFHDVWWCCRVEELTQAEAAEALGVPTGTVATRLRRADELLREALHSKEAPALLGVPIALGAEAEFERGLRELRKGDLDPAHRERLWRRIEDHLDRATVPGADVPPRRSGARFSRSSLVSHAFTLAAGLTAGLAARAPAPPPPRVETHPAPLTALSLAPAALAAPAPAMAAAPEATGLSPSPASSRPAWQPSRPRRGAAGVDDVEHHLRTARAALQRGDARDAADALDAAERSLEPGESREYIESLRIETLVLAGDRDGAQRRLDAFRARHPGSAHLPRLERWLAQR